MAIWNSQSYLNFMQEMYREYKCQVIHEGSLTEAFKINSGLQQGCILSPTLFLIVMGDI